MVLGRKKMDEREWLAAKFEEHRTHLRAVAYRMLGSLAEADEAVQDAWLRVSRAGAEGVENLGGWLTTIVARVCLNALQARRVRSPEAASVHVPDPIVARDGRPDPEQEVLLADAVGLALQIVLETLPPAERLAFVLHDMFDVPFEEIAPIVGRSETATRQLASRGRRRVRGAAPAPDPDLARQRKVVDAFFAAAKSGDFEALVAVLDPEVVIRSDGGERRRAASFVRRGAEEVARNAMAGGLLQGAVLRPALINGAAGALAIYRGEPFALMAFTVANDKVVELDVVFDPDRLARIDFSILEE
jgi:RNA polymerase sigma-70 factor (ECF subfamily)